jgi:hypothetical protein
MPTTDYDLTRIVFLNPVGNSHGCHTLLNVGNSGLQDQGRELVFGSPVEVCSHNERHIQ